MRTVGRTDRYETLRAVAIVLIAVQIAVAALLLMPSAPQLSLTWLLALMFVNFVALIAMFQMPVPPAMRLGLISAMLILLLVIGAKSDPLGFRQIDQEVNAGIESQNMGPVRPAALEAPAGPAGARLMIAGKGLAPVETRIGGPAAEGYSVTMRVIEMGDAVMLLDWSIAREALVKRCGRITMFTSSAALMLHLEPILERAISQSVAARAPLCN